MTAEHLVLQRIDRTRRARPRLTGDRVVLAHGAGGQATQNLVEAVFLHAFADPALAALEDSATVTADATRLAFTTDSYVVTPLFFPGGCIGDLAVNGTVNDLAVSGATPLCLSAGFILEEGFPFSDLIRIATAMSEAAEAAGVRIVTGDTKVVPRGAADGCYITTSGIGVHRGPSSLGVANARPGDAILVSGPVGDHGVTVMLARGGLDLRADIVSDTAPLHGLIADTLAAAGPGMRAMRDATRGGVATILNEIATAARVGIDVDEAAVPVRSVVRGACELLGIDPLYLACEGRVVTVVAPEAALPVLAAMRSHPYGSEAALIGEVTAEPAGTVIARTAFGGTRVVDTLVGDPLPRIC